MWLDPSPSLGLFQSLFQKVNDNLKIFQCRLTFKKNLPSVVCGCTIHFTAQVSQPDSSLFPARYVGGSYLLVISQCSSSPGGLLSTSNFFILKIKWSIQIFANNNKINLPLSICGKSFSGFIIYDSFCIPLLNFNKHIVRRVNLWFLFRFASFNS